MKQPTDKTDSNSEYQPKPSKSAAPVPESTQAFQSAQQAPAQQPQPDRPRQPHAPAKEQPKRHSKYEADEDDDDLSETHDALRRRHELLAADGKQLPADAPSHSEARQQQQPEPACQPDKKELTPPPGMDPNEAKQPVQPREEPRPPINLPVQQLPVSAHQQQLAGQQAFPGQPLLYPGQPQAFYYPQFLPQMAAGGGQMMYPMMFMPQAGQPADGSSPAIPPMMLLPQAGQPGGQQLPFMMPPGAMLYPGMLPQVPPSHQDAQGQGQQPLYFLMPVMLPPQVPLGVQPSVQPPSNRSN